MKPCIRGLKEFKKGCPENSLCPAWVETLGSLHPKVIKQCVDVVIANLLWDLNCNMIGVQQASEGTRNMTGLLSMVITNQSPPEELIRTATKHINESRIKIEQIESRNAKS
jgi:hypothetical protein